jgi:hypothetical protein
MRRLAEPVAGIGRFPSGYRGNFFEEIAMIGRTRPQDHPHGHTYQRMNKLEGMADLLSLLGILALGAAMAFGLLTATGHVTW